MKGKIFNAQEVQAILNGSKVMFREVIKQQPKENDAFLFDDKEQIVFQKDYCPYQVGQKIFCKESFFEDLIYRKFVGYEIENNLSETIKINARYMKQEHSRLTLLIKEIKVERLAEISNADCRSEGEDQWSFICNWNATHKKPEEKFEASPWVWKISCEVVK